MAISDRHSNGCSHDIIRGGDISLSQHLFWLLGHPEAYTLTLPGFGSISEIPPKFSQCTIPARDSTLLALFITGVSGCTV
jgi:cytochrome c oxidase subunit 1